MNEQPVVSRDAILPAQNSSVAPPAASTRLLSLDALRGFDMFWIAGGDWLFIALYKALPFALTAFLAEQVDHQPWVGIRFYDLIFPLFVFIVGVSLVFSLSKALEQGSRAAAIKRILVRSLLLYIFGLLVYGGISKGVENIRWVGVLQRIAIAYCISSLLFCFLRPRALLAVCAGLLITYWALASLVPIRDFNLEHQHLQTLGLTPDAPETLARFLATTNLVSGRFDDGLNLTQHLDYLFLPGYRWDGAYDPEGLLSTLGAVATCLLGIFAGLFLRNSVASDQKKVFCLLGAGAACVIVGYVWGLQFPVIKKLWTSSYVLVAGGYSAILLAAFYQVIEIWGKRKWCIPFVWIGANAITVYMIFHLLDVRKLAELVVGGPIAAALGRWGDLLIAVVIVLGMFAIMRFLYERKIFLRL